MTFYAYLPDRAVLAVSGEDALEFLQGLITKDMRHVEPGQAAFAALLSPQGRFLFDFFITESEGKFLLETDKARLGELKKRLSMYRLRSKVELEEIPQLQVAAIWRTSALAEGYADPRLPELGWRVVGKEILAVAGMQQGDYDAHRLSLGVPEGAKDLIVDRSILLEYGYDELNAVNFDKGCYIGQEVTARSKHRATLRKFVHSVRAEQSLPPKGTPVMAAGREVGVLCGSNDRIGLAHLRVAETGQPALLTAEGIALTATLPSWCRTAFQAES